MREGMAPKRTMIPRGAPLPLSLTLIPSQLPQSGHLHPQSVPGWYGVAAQSTKDSHLKGRHFPFDDAGAIRGGGSGLTTRFAHGRIVCASLAKTQFMLGSDRR
jgi:hypothetical protein